MAAQVQVEQSEPSTSNSIDDEDDTILDDDIIQMHEPDLGVKLVSSRHHQASARGLQEPNVARQRTFLQPQPLPISSFESVPVFETTLPSESRTSSALLNSNVVDKNVASARNSLPIQPRQAPTSSLDVAPHESRADSLVSTLTPTLNHHFSKENGDNCDDSAVSSLTDTLAFHRGSSWSLTGTIEEASASLPRIGQFAFLPKSSRSTTSRGKKEKRKSSRRGGKKKFWHISSQFDQHREYLQENEQLQPPESQRTYHLPFTLGAPQMADSVSSMTRHLATEEEWKEEAQYEGKMEEDIATMSPRSSRYSMTGSIIHRDVESLEENQAYKRSGEQPNFIVEVSSGLPGGHVYSIKSTQERHRKYSSHMQREKPSTNSTTGLVSIDETGNESCSIVAVANDSVSHYRIKSLDKSVSLSISSRKDESNAKGSPNRWKGVQMVDNPARTAPSHEDDVPNTHGLVQEPKWERRLLRYVGVTLVVVFAIFLTLVSFWLDQRRTNKRSN